MLLYTLQKALTRFLVLFVCSLHQRIKNAISTYMNVLFSFLANCFTTESSMYCTPACCMVLSAVLKDSKSRDLKDQCTHRNSSTDHQFLTSQHRHVCEVLCERLGRHPVRTIQKPGVRIELNSLHT